MSGGEMRCCIPGCVNQNPPDASAATEAEADAPAAFFPVPEIEFGDDGGITSDSGLRRALWLRRIKKCTSEFDPDTVLVCSRHFLEGKPAELEETSRVDWLPNAELDSPDDLNEEIEDFVLEEDDDDDEEEDEEFLMYSKRQREKVERLKRENVALKRKISELGQNGIIQGMRLKMLKSMNVDEEEQQPEEEEDEEAADLKSKNVQTPTEFVEVKMEPRETEPEETAPEPDEKPPQPKLQINSLKMKLSNILGTIK